MKSSGLHNLINALKRADIQELEALEFMSYDKMHNYLTSINVDAAQPGTVERAAKLVTAEKNNKKMSWQYLRTTNSNEINKKFITTESIKQKTNNNKKMGTLVKNGDVQQDITRMPDSASVFDLVITRNSANIAQYLPIPLFGALDYESKYKDIISSLIPLSTITYDIALSPTGKGLRFTFVNSVGPATDTVDVECSQVPYVNLLRASQGSILKFSENKINISDVTKQAQFTQAVTLFKNSIFGKLEKDSFTPNQFKSDLQNQNDIRTITVRWDIDQESTNVYMISPTAAFVLTQTSYVESYSTSRS